jgi:hypothetical protein
VHTTDALTFRLVGFVVSLPLRALAPTLPAPQIFGDPYKATVSKEDGSEVEEDIYEAYNLSLVRAAGAACVPPQFAHASALRM